jgi:hypothetical protein
MRTLKTLIHPVFDPGTRSYATAKSLLSDVTKIHLWRSYSSSS